MWLLDLKEALENVSLTSWTVENFTLTVSLGSSSVYSLRPEPLGFLGAWLHLEVPPGQAHKGLNLGIGAVEAWLVSHNYLEPDLADRHLGRG